MWFFHWVHEQRKQGQLKTTMMLFISYVFITEHAKKRGTGSSVFRFTCSIDCLVWIDAKVNTKGVFTSLITTVNQCAQGCQQKNLNVVVSKFCMVAHV